jgi:hypothetical protein
VDSSGSTPSSVTVARGRVTPRMRSWAAAGAWGSRGTTTRPAATMDTSAVAYDTGSVHRNAIRAPTGIPAVSSRPRQASRAARSSA